MDYLLKRTKKTEINSLPLWEGKLQSNAQIRRLRYSESVCFLQNNSIGLRGAVN
jgi:hypothetical protein